MQRDAELENGRIEMKRERERQSAWEVVGGHERKHVGKPCDETVFHRRRDRF